MSPAAALSAALIAAALSSAGMADVDDSALERRHGLSAFGDLKYAPDFQHFDYVNPAAPKGGRIRLASSSGQQTFDHFNPFILEGAAADGASALFDSLMLGAADEPDALYGLVAHSVSMPEDRAYAVFYLRPEARFSDGSPVTAEDVVWTFDTLKAEGAPWYRAPLRAVASATAVDPLTVRYDFEPGVVTRDLPGLVASLPILAKTRYAERAFREVTSDPPIGSGPYRLGAYQFGRWVSFERREDYWAKDLPVRRGQQNFDQIRIEYYVDRDVQLEAFKAGAFDFIEEFTSANWALKYNFPAVERGWVIKEEIPDGRPSGTQGWWINTRREKFQDIRVRRALDYAYDFEQANRQLFFGIYDRTDSFFENSPMQAEGAPSEGELRLLEPLRDELPELKHPAVFGPAYTPPVNTGDGDARPNLLIAQALLEEAGWKVRDGALRNAAGEPFVIELLHFAGGGFDKVVWPFIFNLEVLGIDARLRKIDPAAMKRRLDRFDFDMTVRRFSPGLTPGVSLRTYLHSSAADEKGSFNMSGIRSPAIDALLEEVQKAGSREDLVVAAKAMDRVFRAGHYWVSNWYKGKHAIAYWNRFGKPQDLGLEKPPYARGVLDTWWYEAEASAAVDAARGR
ncbi:MAG: extracellular solute-binding protein [Pseudomonadota bacterium]